MICLVLAAGYATRLYPLTENFPKPLLEVGEKSILDRLLEDLDTTAGVAAKGNEAALISEFVVVSNHKFISHFEQWKQKLAYKTPVTILDDGSVDNENRLGAARDIQFAMEYINKKELQSAGSDSRVTASVDSSDGILVIAGDNVLDFSLSEFVAFACEKGTSCVMCHEENELKKQQKTAIITLDEACAITSYEEKPVEPKGNLAVPPFYYYKKEDILRIEEALNDGCSADAPGSFAAWLSRNTKMHAWKMNGKRYDIGDMASYQAAQEMFKAE